MTQEVGSFGSAALNTAAPRLSLFEVRKLASRLYGIDGEIQSLTSERDQNCRVATREGAVYVIKISNPSESASVIDFQIAALDHIQKEAPSQPVPRVVRTLAGHAHGSVLLPTGEPAVVRMLTYLDGVQVRETTRTAGQRRAMGAGLAGLDAALQGFSHPGASHDLLWNVSAAHRLMDKLNGILEASRRALVDKFMNRFLDHVLPELSFLRAQVIHNDYHLYNVIVAPDNNEKITGIIDFGDMVHAPLVGEVATAAAFQMVGNADPFEGAAQFVGAYHAGFPLTPAEQEIVADLMATRHLITILITEWRAVRYPENRTYIMRHNPAAWDALAFLSTLSRSSSRDRLLAEVNIGVK